MSIRKFLVPTVLFATAILFAGIGISQQKAPEKIDIGAERANAKGFDHIFLESKIGSMKIVPPSDFASGHLVMNFEGTVLISGAQGTVNYEGNIKEEYVNEKYKKKVIHGKGKLILDGKFKGLQWFGKNLTADFKGEAIVRLYGEFDRELKTGLFWYEGAPDYKYDWTSQGWTAYVPQPEPARPAVNAKK